MSKAPPSGLLAGRFAAAEALGAAHRAAAADHRLRRAAGAHHRRRGRQNLPADEREFRTVSAAGRRKEASSGKDRKTGAWRNARLPIWTRGWAKARERSPKLTESSAAGANRLARSRHRRARRELAAAQWNVSVTSRFFIARRRSSAIWRRWNAARSRRASRFCDDRAGTSAAGSNAGNASAARGLRAARGQEMIARAQRQSAAPPRPRADPAPDRKIPPASGPPRASRSSGR